MAQKFEAAVGQYMGSLHCASNVFNACVFLFWQCMLLF